MRQLFVCIAAFLMLACGPWRGEWGPMLNEPGKVEAKTFMPSGHGSGVGVGIPLGGRGGMSIVPTSIDIPARYGVAFRCQHGSFAVEGDANSVAASVWKIVEQGQQVTIYYREYVETNKQTGEKRVTKLHFETAHP